MPSSRRRRDVVTHATVLLLVAVLLVVPLAAPVAAHQDRAELSRVQRKLDAVRRVLADARADADRVAAALVQADRDVTQARAALQAATANHRAAQATCARAALEAARAKLEVDAQQAVIDRRARTTYINNAPSAMLTLLVDADGIGDLLDRSKLLDNVAKAANNELTALVDAKSRPRRPGSGRWPPSSTHASSRRTCGSGPPSWRRSAPPAPPPSGSWNARSPASRSATVPCGPHRPGSSGPSAPRRPPAGVLPRPPAGPPTAATHRDRRCWPTAVASAARTATATSG